MGLLDAFKKNNNTQEPEATQEEVKTYEPAPEVTEAPEANPAGKIVAGMDVTDKEQVDARLREIYAMDKLYTILSLNVADMERGISVPMVLLPKQDVRVMLIFTDYEDAKKYVETSRPMVIEGVYPIGEIKKDDKVNNIDVICANALALGVDAIDFDVATDRAFGCKLAYFMQANKMTGQGQIILSKAELEAAKENGGKVRPRFNGMPMVNFSTDHLLTKVRAAEVEENILGEGGLDWANENTNINELCYVANALNIKAAEKDKAEAGAGDDIRTLVKGLNELIFDRLSELKRWYTICNKESGEIYTKNGAVYLMYTARYFNRMPEGNRQKAIGPSLAELAYEVGDKQVDKVVVTDGPRIMHVINREEFGF